MNHHTKDKGDLGVLKAQVDLFEKGYMILLPQTEHAPFDLVIYKNQTFKRVQVKYRELNKKGILEVRFRSSYSTSNGIVNKKVDKNQIDIYGIYCPQTDECYYFDPKTFKNSFSLRVETPKNNQMQNVKFAKDYREIPQLD
ncbi:group I intron-associated PD-(D/E)XK endonuclease [Paenibacillus sp. BSR1-1]|uniref:group I intron-associated PD-(D/E)XK endonuclease n=1 Tax=Paenibacillus sp. BSR1-1 TaxID=3020845 RepID=UPI0025B096C0|nr:group I intron-associated PD-(D/E)XK endonuclease [Paenibacillus sp. BSR1-1]MDN3018480.1 group I intron-associated PD-(D/E)XK endonuclease [Paenibacillus sp. BSR1-1]